MMAINKLELANRVFNLYKAKYKDEYTLVDNFDQLGPTEKELIFALIDIVLPFFGALTTQAELVKKIWLYVQDDEMDCVGCSVIRKLKQLIPEGLIGNSNKEEIE